MVRASGLLWGTMLLEIVGKSIIKSHKTGYCCTIEYFSKGWYDDFLYVVEAKFYKNEFDMKHNNRCIARMYGKWNSHLILSINGQT